MFWGQKKKKNIIVSKRILNKNLSPSKPKKVAHKQKNTGKNNLKNYHTTITLSHVPRGLLRLLEGFSDDKFLLWSKFYGVIVIAIHPSNTHTYMLICFWGWKLYMCLIFHLIFNIFSSLVRISTFTGRLLMS